MGSFNLSWTAPATSLNQYVKYRTKGSGSWSYSPYITSANPQTNTATSATVGVLPNNWVYQFQIDNVCTAGGAPQSSLIIEDIVFQCIQPTVATTSTTWSFNFGTIGNIDSIVATLIKTSTGAVAGYVTLPNGATSFGFTGLTPSTQYHLSYVMQATVNGVQINSTDYPTQLGAPCTTIPTSTTA